MQRINRSYISPRFEKSFKKLSEDIKKRAIKSIFLFEKNPDYPGLEAHKLKGPLQGLWAFSIGGCFVWGFLVDKESKEIIISK